MKNVEDVYPLSPMQEFMLLHSAHRAHSDVLFNQFCYEIDAELDVEAFRAAWQALLDRHPILRTAFVWEKVKSPVQVVRRALELPFRVLDWSDRDPREHDALLEAVRAEDRAESFELTRAPLTRVTLVRRDTARHYLLWSSHHLLVDRWCLGTLFDELNTLYRASLRGRPAALPPARPFREFIAWVAKQDAGEARRYWRDTLRGFTRPTPLCRRDRESPAQPGDTARGAVDLQGADFGALRARARVEGLTLGSLVYGAWALVVHSVSGARDVLFGAAVSGRPPDLPGVESIVGCFINNLPVRVRLHADATPLEVARAVQRQQQQQMRFEYLSPATIAACSDCDGSQPLFDNLLVWLSPAGSEAAEALPLRLLPGRLDTAYPLAVAIAETDRSLALRCHVAPGHRCAVPPQEMLERLAQTLRMLAGEDARTALGDQPRFESLRTGSAAESVENPWTSAELPARAAAASGAIDATGAGRAADPAETVAEGLAAIWQEVLGHDDFDADSSFFEVGGNSLLAATLQTRLQASLRRSIPLLPLFAVPTLAGMKQTLLAADWPLSPEFVTALRRQGRRAPLFGIASPEVNTLGFSVLTRHMTPDRPVYLVQSPPVSGHVRRLSPYELPALCARYVEAVRQVQRRGPYHLVGMCTGAQMALEMCRLLEQDGEQVGFVGLVDTWAFYTVSRLHKVQRIGSQIRYYRRRVREVLQLGPVERRTELLRIAGLGAVRESNVGETLAAPASATRQAACADDLAEDARIDREWLVDFGLPENYTPRPKVTTPVTVFRIRPQPYWRVRDHTLGWGRLAQTVRIEHLPGNNHQHVLREPQVRALARGLDRCLESAVPPGDSGTTAA